MDIASGQNSVRLMRLDIFIGKNNRIGMICVRVKLWSIFVGKSAHRDRDKFDVLT